MKTLPIGLLDRLRKEALADLRKRKGTEGRSSEVSVRNGVQREIVATMGLDGLLYVGFVFTDKRNRDTIVTRRTLGCAKDALQVERYKTEPHYDEPRVYHQLGTIRQLEGEMSIAYDLVLRGRKAVNTHKMANRC